MKKGWAGESHRHSCSKRGISTKYTTDEVKIANMTSRTTPNKKSGVGTEAITPKVVLKYAEKTDKILDFGSGKYPAYTIWLKNQGFDVTAYEFGNNINPAYHDANALQKKYNIVFASNVLNVQSSEEMLDTTLNDIKKSLLPGGLFIGNYPTKPRKMNMTSKELEQKFKQYFKSVKMDDGVYILER